MSKAEDAIKEFMEYLTTYRKIIKAAQIIGTKYDVGLNAHTIPTKLKYKLTYILKKHGVKIDEE